MSVQVVSATYEVDDYAQEDGRRYVRETFTLDNGEVRTSSYLADLQADYSAHLEAMRTGIQAELDRPPPPDEPA